MAVDKIPLHHYKSMTPFWPGIHENQTGNGACQIRIYKRMYYHSLNHKITTAPFTNMD